jgi:hypothetical protein
MSGAEAVITLALAQVGLEEVPRGSNRGPDIDKFTGGNAVPYCALGICWLFRECGRAIPGDFVPTPGRMSPLCSVTHMERVFTEHDWMVMAPQPGDVVFYKDRGLSDRGPGRHVGLVVEVNDYGQTFRTVEFNWSQGVRSRWVKREDPKVVGFGRRP